MSSIDQLRQGVLIRLSRVEGLRARYAADLWESIHLRMAKGQPKAPKEPVEKPLFNPEKMNPLESTPAVAGDNVAFPSPMQTLGSKSQRADMGSAVVDSFDETDPTGSSRDSMTHIEPKAGRPKEVDATMSGSDAMTRGKGKKGAPGQEIDLPILAGMLKHVQQSGDKYSEVHGALQGEFHDSLKRAHKEFRSLQDISSKVGEDWWKSYQYIGTGPVAARMYNLREAMADESSSEEERKASHDEYMFYAEQYAQLAARGRAMFNEHKSEKALPGWITDTGMLADSSAGAGEGDEDEDRKKGESETARAKRHLGEAGVGLNMDIARMLKIMRDEIRQSHEDVQGNKGSPDILDRVQAHRRKLEAYYQLEAMTSNMEVGSHAVAQAQNPTMNAFASWYPEGAMRALATQVDTFNTSPAYKMVAGKFGQVVKDSNGVHRLQFATPEQAANALMFLSLVGPTSANETPASNWRIATGVLEDGIYQWAKAHEGNPEALAKGPELVDILAHASEDRGHLGHFSEYGDQSSYKAVKGAYLNMTPEERLKHHDFAREALLSARDQKTVESTPDALAAWIQNHGKEAPSWVKDKQGKYRLLPMERESFATLNSNIGAYKRAEKNHKNAISAATSLYEKAKASLNASVKKDAASTDRAIQDTLAKLPESERAGITTLAQLRSHLNGRIKEITGPIDSEGLPKLEALQGQLRQGAEASSVQDFMDGLQVKGDKAMNRKAKDFLGAMRKQQGRGQFVGNEWDATRGTDLIYRKDSEGNYNTESKSLLGRPDSIKRFLKLSKLLSDAQRTAQGFDGTNLTRDQKVEALTSAIQSRDNGEIFGTLMKPDVARQAFPGSDNPRDDHARNLAEMLVDHSDRPSMMAALFLSSAQDHHMLNRVMPVSNNTWFSKNKDDSWSYNDETQMTPEQVAALPQDQKSGGANVMGPKFGPYFRSVAGGAMRALAQFMNGHLTTPADRYVADRVMTEIHGQALGRRLGGTPENETQRAAWHSGITMLGKILGEKMGGEALPVDRIQAIVWASQQAQASALGAVNPTEQLYTGAEDVYRTHILHARRVIQEHGKSDSPAVQQYVQECRDFLASAAPLRVKTKGEDGSLYGRFNHVPLAGDDLVGAKHDRNAQDVMLQLRDAGSGPVGGLSAEAQKLLSEGRKKYGRSGYAVAGRQGGSVRVGGDSQAPDRKVHAGGGRHGGQRPHAGEKAVPPVPALHGGKPKPVVTARANGTGGNGASRTSHDVPAGNRLKYGNQLMQAFLLGSSKNAKDFLKQFGEVANQAGVPVKSYNGVGDAFSSSTPATAHIASQAVDPETARYLAAWSGLLGNRQSVMVFHPDEQGSDRLYSIKFPKTNMQEVRGALDRAGIQHRTIIPGGKTTHVMVYDPSQVMRAAVGQLAEDHNAIVSESAGRSEFLGRPTSSPSANPSADPIADARSHYRRIIADYEESRGGSVPTGAPAVGGDSGASVPGTESPAGHGQAPAGGSIVRGVTYQGGKFTPSAEQKAPPATQEGSPTRYSRLAERFAGAFPGPMPDHDKKAIEGLAARTTAQGLTVGQRYPDSKGDWADKAHAQVNPGGGFSPAPPVNHASPLIQGVTQLPNGILDPRGLVSGLTGDIGRGNASFDDINYFMPSKAAHYGVFDAYREHPGGKPHYGTPDGMVFLSPDTANKHVMSNPHLADLHGKVHAPWMAMPDRVRTWKGADALMQAIQSDPMLPHHERDHELVHDAFNGDLDADITPSVIRILSSEPSRMSRLVGLMRSHLGIGEPVAPQQGMGGVSELTGALDGMWRDLSPAHTTTTRFSAGQLMHQAATSGGTASPGTLAQHSGKWAFANVPGVGKAVWEHLFHQIPGAFENGLSFQHLTDDGRPTSKVELQGVPTLWAMGDLAQQHARLANAGVRYNNPRQSVWNPSSEYLPALTREFLSRPVRMVRRFPDQAKLLLGLMTGALRSH